MTKLSHSNLLSTLESLPGNHYGTGRTMSLGGSYSSGYGDQCCPPVVDPYTFLALIGGIALATFFLQMAIVNIIGKKRRRRDAGGEEWISGEEVLSDEMGSSQDSYFAQFLPRPHGSDSTWVDTLSENILSLG